MRFVWTPIAVLVLISGVLGFFQNCTPAVPYGDTDYYSELLSSSVFPYDTGFDQVAYMSCSEQEDIYNDGTFFTFRVGAYNNLGIRVSQTYRDNASRGLLDDSIVSVLQQNDTSAGTRLQLAVRTLDNFQLIWVDPDNGSQGLIGFDYANFFPSMGDETFVETLWYMQPGDYMRYWAGAQVVDDYRFEGDLNFSRSELIERDLRNFFSSRGIITLTFNKEGEIAPLGPGSFANLVPSVQDPATGSGGGVGTASAGQIQTSANNDLRKEVFGMAVQPRFRVPFVLGGGNPGTLPPRALSSINEVAMDSRPDAPQARPWNCADNMQFMIVMPDDAVRADNTIRCAMSPDPANPSPTLQAIRRSLYAEDFYVDTVRRCVVPKRDHVVEGSCYGINSASGVSHLVNYDSFNDPMQGCGIGNANGVCPHYVSICIRQ